MSERTYIAIDLKSFYASVECIERGLDPLTTNLVVADASRTEKTICLAVSPSLKSFGIPGRPRLFEVVQKVKEVNIERKSKAPGRKFTGASFNAVELAKSSDLEVAYIAAAPRMAYYMEYSTKIFDIYLRYIASEDMHVYSIDEVFIDATTYLTTYKMTAHELALKMIRDVLAETGVTATAGIGTNMYLCKVAMDIVAKKMPADKDGVRIAELDEMSYRKLLWNHVPLTDFWRVGPGYAKKLWQMAYIQWAILHAVLWVSLMNIITRHFCISSLESMQSFLSTMHGGGSLPQLQRLNPINRRRTAWVPGRYFTVPTLQKRQS